MKTLTEYISENIILEEFLSRCKEYKLDFDITPHGEGRYYRDAESGNIITRDEVIYTLYKIVHNIKEYIDDNIIKDTDRFGVIDKSRNVNLYLLCQYNKDKDLITVVTVAKRKYFPFHDIVTTFNTYKNDNKVKREYVLR